MLVFLFFYLHLIVLIQSSEIGFEKSQEDCTQNKCDLSFNEASNQNQFPSYSEWRSPIGVDEIFTNSNMVYNNNNETADMLNTLDITDMDEGNSPKVIYNLDTVTNLEDTNNGMDFEETGNYTNLVHNTEIKEPFQTDSPLKIFTDFTKKRRKAFVQEFDEALPSCFQNLVKEKEAEIVIKKKSKQKKIQDPLKMINHKKPLWKKTSNSKKEKIQIKDTDRFKKGVLLSKINSLGKMTDRGTTYYNLALKLIMDQKYQSILFHVNTADYFDEAFGILNERRYETVWFSDYSSISSKIYRLLDGNKEHLKLVDDCSDVFCLINTMEFSQLFIALLTVFNKYQYYHVRFDFKRSFKGKEENIKKLQIKNDNIKDLSEKCNMIISMNRLNETGFKTKILYNILKIIFFLPGEDLSDEYMQFQNKLDDLYNFHKSFLENINEFMNEMKKFINPEGKSHLIILFDEAQKACHLIDISINTLTETMEELYCFIKERLHDETTFVNFFFKVLGSIIGNRLILKGKEDYDVFAVMEPFYKIIKSCERIIGSNIIEGSLSQSENSKKEIFDSDGGLVYIFILYSQLNIYHNFLHIIKAYTSDCVATINKSKISTNFEKHLTTATVRAYLEQMTSGIQRINDLINFLINKKQSASELIHACNMKESLFIKCKKLKKILPMKKYEDDEIMRDLKSTCNDLINGYLEFYEFVKKL